MSGLEAVSLSRRRKTELDCPAQMETGDVSGDKDVGDGAARKEEEMYGWSGGGRGQG